MARELLTSWGEYEMALDRLLSMACHKIRIYDEDLVALKLESSAHQEDLKRLLTPSNPDALQIALRNGEPLRRQFPFLLKLLTLHSHQASARQTSPQFAHLRDNMVLVDDKHALIRFDRDQARSKLLIDEPEELKPYLHRFTEIMAEEGEAIGGTTLGL